MKKPTKVVMLPTEGYGKKGQVVYNWDMDLIILEKDAKKSNCCKPQNVYITVSQDIEPIKEGDWFYAPYNSIKSILQCTDSSMLDRKDLGEKIIATDDPKLIIDVSSNAQKESYIKEWTILPQVQQSFLKEFVANPNGKWEVDYKVMHKTNQGIISSNDVSILQQSGSKIKVKGKVNKLKLNSDNTVNITSSCNLGPFKPTRMNMDKVKSFNITSVKEKMYSREEIIKLIEKHSDFVSEHIDYEGIDNATTAIGYPEWDDINWIKENL
jgi:hypothetical protein